MTLTTIFLQMRILFAKCWEILQGKYNGNEVDDSMMINGCSQMCQHKQDLVSVVGMYIQQRFVATEMEFEVVSNTLCTTFT
jgi:hypothetical protein